MTKDRLFKKEYAKELFTVASDDLEGARALVSAQVRRQEISLFHVQQAIEKALKAYLVWTGKPVPMVPSLGLLVDRIGVSANIPHSDSLEDLTQFATIRRYEEGVALFTSEEIEQSLAAAEDVINWVKAQLV
jgi:HEPN domain-containing protein